MSTTLCPSLANWSEEALHENPDDSDDTMEAKFHERKWRQQARREAEAEWECRAQGECEARARAEALRHVAKEQECQRVAVVATAAKGKVCIRPTHRHERVCTADGPKKYPLATGN